MKTITINPNESGQRLDRFMKKYLCAAPLSLIYRIIRKDVKVNGARAGIDYVLAEGDEITLYMDDQRTEELSRRRSRSGAFGARRGAKVQFTVCFEDDHILAVSKPYGLLTHGDETEKKNTLVNQVTGFLLDRGSYDPGAERLFTPSPVHRLDRNTSGLVIFGKDAKAVRDFSRMLTASECVRKYYTALVTGIVAEQLVLTGGILKDEKNNKVEVTDEGKASETIVTPIRSFGKKYTLCAVRLVTGRPHQIRAHLAAAGHPVAGDPKYGNYAANRRFSKISGIESQFLHAARMEIAEGRGSLEYLTGTVIECPLSQRLESALENL